MAERALAAEVPADANARMYSLSGCRKTVGFSSARETLYVCYLTDQPAPCRLSWYKQRDSWEVRGLCWVSESRDLRNRTKGPRPRLDSHRTAHAKYQAQDPGSVWKGRCWQEYLLSTACICACCQKQGSRFHLRFLHNLMCSLANYSLA